MADNVLERQPRSWLVASAAAAGIALLYRYASHAGFSNDHFVHLARAQAVLAGDWPVRDYMEEGVPLTVLLSAGAQRVLGESPFAELVLSSGAMAVAAGVTCWLTAALTRSTLVGLGAALLQVLARPRLYSYPKILLYPVLVLLAWRYLDRPSRARLATLAGFTVVGFLLRHDHGVYVGLGACAAIVIANWQRGIPVAAARLGEFGLLSLLFVSPYLAYTQYYGGVVSYFRTGIAISQNEAARTTGVRASLQLPAGRWLEPRPPDPVRLPVVRVRWQPSVGPARRVSLERAIGLHHPEHDTGTTWVYRIEPPVGDTLAKLVALPDAADTGGFDRRTLTLDVPVPWYIEARHAAGLGGSLAVGPRLDGALSPRNQAVVLYWFVWSLPLAAVVCLLVQGRRGRPLRAGPVLALAAIVVITRIGLFRESLETRASDVYGTVPILTMWVLAAIWAGRSQPVIWRWTSRAVATIVLLGVIVATGVVGGAADFVSRAGFLDGPSAVKQRIDEVTEDARTYPWPKQWPAGDGWRVARYVRDCTVPGDRLLVTWNKPEMYVWAQRPFASGETLLVPALRPPALFAARALARLQTQSVPIVLVQPSTYAEDFQTLYPAIAAFIEDRYRKVGHFGNDTRDDVDVYVEKVRTPTGVDSEFQWPCFK